jgi:hypothetical protein
LGHFLPRKKLCINFDQKWGGLHLGRFFTNSSGHPAHGVLAVPCREKYLLDSRKFCACSYALNFKKVARVWEQTQEDLSGFINFPITLPLSHSRSQNSLILLRMYTSIPEVCG